MDEIKVWVQIFFEDGSVSEGKRVPADFLDQDPPEMMRRVIENILRGLNRTEGHVLIWGAGNMIFQKFTIFSLSQESDFSAAL